MAGKEPAELYDRDFFEWTACNARLIRSGQLEQADLEHIAEEIEDMGRRDQREVRSRLEVLIARLLKWQFQPGRRSTDSGASSWMSTIDEQRRELGGIFAQSPSLQRHGCNALAEVYPKALRSAARETNVPCRRISARMPVQFRTDPGFGLLSRITRATLLES